VSREETRSWEGVGADWAARNPQRTWREHSDAVNRRLLERWWVHPASGRVLKTDAFDEAFGEGLAPWLAGESTRVVLIDVSLPTLVAARARAARATVVCGDARELPFKSTAFDATVSLSTLDHFATIRELERGIEELARVLRPGAAAVVTLDNPYNPAVALRNRLPSRWLRRIGLVPYPVGATLSREELVLKIEDSGFEIREVCAILHGPRAPAVAVAWLVDLTGAGRLRRTFLRLATAFERLAETPLRFRTGYYVAVQAVRR
jgi:SAM-dependent methyltransferase